MEKNNYNVFQFENTKFDSYNTSNFIKYVITVENDEFVSLDFLNDVFPFIVLTMIISSVIFIFTLENYLINKSDDYQGNPANYNIKARHLFKFMFIFTIAIIVIFCVVSLCTIKNEGILFNKNLEKYTTKNTMFITNSDYQTISNNFKSRFQYNDFSNNNNADYVYDVSINYTLNNYALISNMRKYKTIKNVTKNLNIKVENIFMTMINDENNFLTNLKENNITIDKVYINLLEVKPRLKNIEQILKSNSIEYSVSEYDKNRVSSIKEKLNLLKKEKIKK